MMVNEGTTTVLADGGMQSMTYATCLLPGCSMQSPVSSKTASIHAIHADEEYIAFAPKQSNIERVTGGSWVWDEEESSSPEVPQWNPRTGFMGDVTSSSSDRESNGANASTSEPLVEVQASMLTAPVQGDAPLPSVPKDQVGPASHPSAASLMPPTGFFSSEHL